jgi:hypothetical protein
MEFKKNLTIHVCQFIGGQGVFPFWLDKVEKWYIIIKFGVP